MSGGHSKRSLEQPLPCQDFGGSCRLIFLEQDQTLVSPVSVRASFEECGRPRLRDCRTDLPGHGAGWAAWAYPQMAS